MKSTLLKRKGAAIAVLGASLMLASCGGGFSNTGKINNGDICITNDFRTIPNCKNGELIAFLPNSWGNDQLPLYFITLHCDFNHKIVYNRSGVVCVYTNKRNKRNKKLLENNSKK